jgi:CubicO group peptidase (beta-lactamase class C family)
MKRVIAVPLCAGLALSLGTNVWAQGLPAADPAVVGIAPERLGRIGEVFRRDVEAGSIPGAVMLIARRGKLAYHEAFGMRDVAAHASMPKDAIFRLGSMTKPLTITAAMMLVEEGKLSLDDPIANYLPQFAKMQVGIEHDDPQSGEVSLEVVPARRPITIVDLMRHTSGFTYEALGSGPRVKELYREAGIHSRDQTDAEVVDKLAKLPLMHQPQTVWEYGRSMDVLGRILEIVTGEPLSDLLADRLLRPLHMNDSGFWVPTEKQNRIANIFPTGPGGRRLLVDVTKPPKFIGGGSGLVSTASDYARFLQMLLNGGTLDGVRILGRHAVELMTADQLGPDIKAQGWSYYPGPGYGYGLGFAVRRTLGVSPQIGSVGDYFVEGVYGTFAFVDPSKQLLAVLMVQSQEWRYYRPVVKVLVLQSLVN